VVVFEIGGEDAIYRYTTWINRARRRVGFIEVMGGTTVWLTPQLGERRLMFEFGGMEPVEDAAGVLA